MPFLLTQAQVNDLHHAIVGANLTNSRAALLGGVDATFRASLGSAASPGDQLMSDLWALAAADLIDGSIPIVTWLENAIVLAGAQVQATVFKRVLQQILARSAGGVRRTLHNLPFPRNDDFVGRDDLLTKLHQLLAPVGGGPPRAPVSLVGLPGMGKTQLALAYIYEHLNDYETVLWVNAEGAGLTARVADLAKPLGLSRPPREEPADTADAVRQRLQEGGPHLLVFDNVDEESNYAGHIPRSGEARVLITTTLTDLQGTRALDVDALDEEAGLGLLIGKCQYDAEDLADAKSLADELGYLTLALEIASRILARGVRTPAMLLAELRGDRESSWITRLDTDPVYGKDLNINRLFDASVRRLRDASSRDRCAFQILLVGGWFAPVGIDLDLLLDAARRLRVGEDRHDDYLEGLERLVELGLVHYEKPFAVFHRLIQQYARHRDEQTRNGDAERAVVAELACLVKDISIDQLSLLEMARYCPHVELAVTRLASADAPVDPPLLEMTLQLVKHLVAIGEFERAAELASVIAARAEPTALLADLLHEGARAAERQWKHPQALEMYRRALAMKEALLTGERWKLACTLGAIGQVLCYEGRYSEAMPLFNRAETIVDEAVDMPRLEAAEVEILVGRAHILREVYGEALIHLSKALGLLESEYHGDDQPELARALHAQGRALAGQGRYVDAVAALEKALGINLRIFGDRHVETARNRHALGWALVAQGSYAEARRAFDLALAVKRDSLGSDRPETARTLHALGWVDIYQGRFEDAVSHFRAALAIQERALTTANAYTASSRYGLGWALARQGRLEEGGKLLQSALASLDGVSAGDYAAEPLVARILQASAWVLGKLGRRVEALQTVAAALEAADRTLGADHDHTLQMRFDEGQLRFEGGDASGADEMRSAASALAEKLGADHPVVRALRSQLDLLDVTGVRPLPE